MRPFFLIPVAILIGLISFWIFSSRSGVKYEFVEVAKGSISEEVSVTGNIKPAEEINLAFENSGRIVRVNGAVGDKVSAGQIILELDTRELNAKLLEATASVEAATAKLNELKRGTRPEELQIKGTELKKAEQDLENEYTNVIDILNDAYTKSDDAVRTKTGAVFIGSGDTAYKLTFTSCDTDAAADAPWLRFTADADLKKWQTELRPLGSTADTALLDAALISAKTYLGKFKTFLERTTDTFVGGCTSVSPNLDTYRTSVSAGRTSVVSALLAVSDNRQEILSQELTTERLRQELALARAGSAPEEIAAQAALVKQAEAQAESTRAQIEKKFLRAPIKGTITKQDGSKGEIIAPNIPLVSVISESDLEIEANIPEIDIGKIKISDPVTITLDAYGDTVKFFGRVISVDPATTVIEGVPTYKTKIQLDKEDGRIKPGMTANITIKTAERQDALIIPQRSVLFEGEKRFLYVLKSDGTREKREVKPGIRGSDGNIEVLEGLSAGEKVLTTPSE